MKGPLEYKRQARAAIANELSAEGRDEDARLCLAGMRDNAATLAMTTALMNADLRISAAERSGQIAGTLFGVFVGFIVGVILLA